MNWRYRLAYKEAVEKLSQFIVWRLLPYRIRYWVVIRAWAEATQGRWTSQEPPSVTAHEILRRMR
jgi:hypothetical protein